MNRPAIEHVFAAGSSASGKSTLLRYFARGGNCEAVAGTPAERDMIIYDPTNAPQDHHDGWRVNLQRWYNDAPRTWQFNNPAAFVAAARRAQNADLYIDEATDIFSLSLKQNHYLMTTGRHSGNRLFIASQRPAQIAPTVRNQCTCLFIFRLGLNDRRAMLMDAGHDWKELKEGGLQLPTAAGDYVFADNIEGKVRNGRLQK